MYLKSDIFIRMINPKSLSEMAYSLRQITLADTKIALSSLLPKV